jgi:2-polyprenyl-3-methyl-5-hydroxy-6-metoxy-1,4-benzoquinol methylase
MPRKLSELLLSVVTSKKTKRLSALNELLDFFALRGKNNELIALHNELKLILEESHQQWPYHDYGEGYFYQSNHDLSIRGLRNTDFRFSFYRLEELLTENTRVLDIGCNAGFLSLKMARYCKHVDAFDLNPFLIRIAKKCSQFEGINNVTFSCSTFDDFPINSSYSMILSLANHHTFDGNMRPDFRKYMERIRKIIESGGQLIFESHPKEYKDPLLKKHLDSVADLFKIESEKLVLTRQSIFDTNRLVVWMSAV